MQRTIFDSSPRCGRRVATPPGYLKAKPKPPTNAMLSCPRPKKQNHKKTHVPQDPHLQKSHNQSLDGVIVLRQHLLDGFGDL